MLNEIEQTKNILHKRAIRNYTQKKCLLILKAWLYILENRQYEGFLKKSSSHNRLL